MNFVVDQNLPVWLAVWLRNAGHDAVHLRELSMQSADDAAVAELARALDAAILSKDADFAKPLSAGPLVVWVGVGNAGHGKLAAIPERSWPEIERALEAGERLVELRA